MTDAEQLDLVFDRMTRQLLRTYAVLVDYKSRLW